MFGALAILNTILNSLYSMIEYRLSRNLRIYVSTFLVIIFAIMIAFRPHYIPDTIAYINVFTIMESISINGNNAIAELGLDMEWGFLYLIKFFHIIGIDNYVVFFILLSIINSILVVWASSKIIKLINKELEKSESLIAHKSKYKFGIVLAIYFSYYGLMHNAITLRAGLSLTLSLVVIAFFMEKKYLKALLVFLVALSFHSLSILIPIVLVMYKVIPRLPARAYRLILIVNGVFLFFRSRTVITSLTIEFSTKISDYIPVLRPLIRYLYNNNANAEFALRNVFFYALSWYFIRFKLKSEIFYKMYNIFLVGISLMIGLNNIMGISRVYDYMLFYIILLQYCMYEYKKKKTVFDKFVFISILVSFTFFSLRTMRII